MYVGTKYIYICIYIPCALYIVYMTVLYSMYAYIYIYINAIARIVILSALDSPDG